MFRYDPIIVQSHNYITQPFLLKFNYLHFYVKYSFFKHHSLGNSNLYFILIFMTKYIFPGETHKSTLLDDSVDLPEQEPKLNNIGFTGERFKCLFCEKENCANPRYCENAIKVMIFQLEQIFKYFITILILRLF